MAVTGVVGRIDSDGQFINLEGTDTDHMFNAVFCDTNGDTRVIHQITQITSDSTITVCGKITEVGDFMGYSMDIHYIK